MAAAAAAAGCMFITVNLACCGWLVGGMVDDCEDLYGRSLLPRRTSLRSVDVVSPGDLSHGSPGNSWNSPGGDVAEN